MSAVAAEPQTQPSCTRRPARSAGDECRPRLSVGLPVYNGENYLKEALESLLGQSYENFEIIISDNASTDGTADICRRYEKQDSRVRYIRQPRNLGPASNRNFVAEAKGELFMEAYHDDLWARNFVKSCVTALDEHPRVVLAHSWVAAIDGTGDVMQAMEYPLATDSLSAPERFQSLLFGTGGNDYGLIRAEAGSGVIRGEVLRRIAPLGSFYHADSILTVESALHGPFHQIRDWLYFRRDHPDRALHANPTVRNWCANMDPHRTDRLRHPLVRLYGEYLWGYVAAIRRAPLSSADRRECYRHLAAWAAGRAAHGGMLQARELAPIPPPAITSEVVNATVGGRTSRAPLAPL